MSTSRFQSPIDLGIGIIWKILFLLPGNDVTRLKCVSKSWFHLINDPKFVREYRLRRRFKFPGERFVGLFFQNTVDYNAKRLEYVCFSQFFGSRIRVHALDFLPYRVLVCVGTRHGLMLCSSSLSRPFVYYPLYCVCNPITKQWVILPVPKTRHGNLVVHTGFFVDEIEGNYYVVHVDNLTGAQGKPIVVEAFSSVNWEWKVLVFDVSPPLSSDVLLGLSSIMPAAIQLNGALHWLCQSGSILAYDVKEECIFYLPIPNLSSLRITRCDGFLAKFRGCLLFIHCNELRTYLNLWMLEDYKNGSYGQWKLTRTLITAIPLKQICRFMIKLFAGGVILPFPNGYVRATPIWFDECHPGMLFFRMDFPEPSNLPSVIVYYNAVKEQVERIWKFSTDIPQWSQVTFSYVLPELPLSVHPSVVNKVWDKR